MSDLPVAAVTYIGLPIGSGGAHSLGRMPLRVAFERTNEFLANCTEQVGPVKCSFTLRDVPELPRQPDVEARLARQFGEGWASAVPEDRLEDALDFMVELQPQPTNQWGMTPIWFRTSVGFRILDPDTGQPLPGQDIERFGGAEYEWSVPLGSSGLRLMLDNRASLGLELCIPDADPDLLRRIVPWLQEHLPCRLSAKQWRTWTPTKTGSFRARKRSLATGS
jgi:hypothetical protein